MAVLKMNFLSQMLGMQTNVTICIPSASFADKMAGREEVYVPGMKYQVLWLLHGGSGDDSDYVNFSNIVRYADEHKVAVVMPADFNKFYTDEPDNPMGGRYFSFVTEELPQLCRSFFPFSDKREDNFVAGLSMGSGGAMKCALLHPEQYGAALIMSGGGCRLHAPEDQPLKTFIRKVLADEDVSGCSVPQPWAADLQMVIPAYEILKAGTALPKLKFTCGGSDPFLGDVKLCLEFYTKLGLQYEWEEIPGYRHEWDFWDLALRKAFSDWLPIRHSAIYPTD